MGGIVVAGTHSGSGKTTVTLGLMAALRKKGLAVQPFKAGPDFIDAGLHRLAADQISRNLDLWMCGPDYVKACFAKHAAGSDIAVVEGVMGLYDGDRSTATLAALLDLPVVLVVDAYGMAESAGAVVRGFVECGVRSAECGGRQEPIYFAGVIFNRVASESHFERVKNSVRDIPVLGYLPRDLNFEIPHRHLGLTTVEENPLGKESLSRLADVMLERINIDKIIQNAGNRNKENDNREGAEDAKNGKPVRIAIARDRAFSFYYEDNLDMLRAGGAKIIHFSPLADEAIPDADAVYFGGGYPELHAEALSRNESMRASVRNWAESGNAMYAECGGLMYLSQAITGDGVKFPMAGIFPFETRMLGKPRLGYRAVALREDSIIGRAGDVRRGHEFHYSEIVGVNAGSAYQVTDSRGKALPDEGFRYKRTLASYIHLHFGSDARCASQFISYVREK
ncbi:MAG: cobyrinate a,c-diamide synthase [Nitrospirota bacterium]|nr:cobyrinate a,c-diamide synthase [Nitrospirota bacterium]